MGIAANIACEHLLVSLEATTGENDVGREEIMEKTIVLADFETTDGAGIISEEADSFSLVVYIAVVKLADVLEDFLDDGIASTVREDEVLIGIEFE